MEEEWTCGDGGGRYRKAAMRGGMAAGKGKGEGYGVCAQGRMIFMVRPSMVRMYTRVRDKKRNEKSW